jgi:hypothetical protein
MIYTSTTVITTFPFLSGHVQTEHVHAAYDFMLQATVALFHQFLYQASEGPLTLHPYKPRFSI